VGHGLVLRPGYGHRRNYVEAHLCDAAVVFPGAEGTVSEMAFCLALCRPLVVLDRKWEDACLSEGPRRQAALLRVAAEARIAMDKEKATPSLLDRPISDALDCVRADQDLGTCTYHPLPNEEGAGAVLDLLLGQLGPEDRRGAFLDLPEYRNAAAGYQGWIAQAEQSGRRRTAPAPDDQSLRTSASTASNALRAAMRTGSQTGENGGA
jgi:hypothetical protein